MRTPTNPWPQRAVFSVLACLVAVTSLTISDGTPAAGERGDRRDRPTITRDRAARGVSLGDRRLRRGRPAAGVRRPTTTTGTLVPVVPTVGPAPTTAAATTTTATTPPVGTTSTTASPAPTTTTVRPRPTTTVATTTTTAIATTTTASATTTTTARATTTTAPAGALVDDVGIAIGSGLLDLSADVIRFAAGEVARSGAGWVRIDVDWTAVEPSPGAFRWTELDRVETEARRAGLKVLGVLAYTPAWARPAGTTDKTPPSDPAAFARFAGAVAARYADDATAFRAWEIWNEPNVSTFWQPKPDPAGYAALLRGAATAMRAADPGVVIVSGGVAPAVDDPAGVEIAPETFVAAVLANGAGSSFDVLGAHPYSYPARPDDDTTQAWNSFVRLPLLRAALDRVGRRGVPIWLTEVGAPTGSASRAVSETDQADIIERAVRVARGLPYVQRTFVYTLRDRAGAPANDIEAHFGLQRADGSLKPAWTAFVRAIRRSS